MAGFGSNPSDSRVSATAKCPWRAASIRAVQPLAPGRSRREALRESRLDTAATSPLDAASTNLSTNSSIRFILTL